MVQFNVFVFLLFVSGTCGGCILNIDYNGILRHWQLHLCSEIPFINKNPEISIEKQSIEPKSLSSGNTKQTSRDQKGNNQKLIDETRRKNYAIDRAVKPSDTGKNQKPTERNYEMDRGVKPSESGNNQKPTERNYGMDRGVKPSESGNNQKPTERNYGIDREVKPSNTGKNQKPTERNYGMDRGVKPSESGNNQKPTERNYGMDRGVKPSDTGNNQKPTERNYGMDRGVKPTDVLMNPQLITAKESTSTSISTSTTWVIFLMALVALVVTFLVVLVIGAICRRLPAPAPETSQPTNGQTDKHIYEEVVDKGIRNRPPLPVPEKVVHIYNTPYDHTPWFQKLP